MEVYDSTSSEARLHDPAQQTLAAVRAAGADEAAISLAQRQKAQDVSTEG